MDKEDGGAVRAGAGGGVEEVVACGLEMGVSEVDIGDLEGEVGEGGTGFKELPGNGAIGGEGGEELEGGVEEDFTDLVRAKNVFAMEFVEA